MPTTSSSLSHRLLRLLAGLIVTAAIMLVLASVVLAIGVYSGLWYGPKTITALRFSPWPAVSFAHHPIVFQDFLEMRIGLEQQRVVDPQRFLRLTNRASTEPMAAVALDTLIRNAATEQAARTLQVSLSPAEVEQAYSAQVVQAGDVTRAAEIIHGLYHWTPDQFQRHVLRTALLRDRIQEALSFNDQLNAVARKQAEEVQVVAQTAGQDFAQVAKRFSQDEFALQGGDMGFVTSGELDKNIDQVAFTLALGQVSGLIHSRYGWHILKVEEKRTVNDQAEVRLRQIFISAPSVDQYIKKVLTESRVVEFVPGIGWDSQSLRAVEAR